MEELVILQYGSFIALGERMKYDTQQTGCLKRVTDWAPWSVIPHQAKKRLPGLEHCQLPRMGTLLTGAPAPQCSCHVAEGKGEDHLKIPLTLAKWAGQISGPWTPLCQDASGVHWQRDTGPGRTGELAEYVLAPVNSSTGGRKGAWWS